MTEENQIKTNETKFCKFYEKVIYMCVLYIVVFLKYDYNIMVNAPLQPADQPTSRRPLWVFCVSLIITILFIQSIHIHHHLTSNTSIYSISSELNFKLLCAFLLLLQLNRNHYLLCCCVDAVAVGCSPQLDLLSMNIFNQIIVYVCVCTYYDF